ncbi:hypothetical protein [Kineococcus rhizosphaerae]|uniref:Trypsin n=1 Tax=Kineococcus rhizosphaerae TaxID=559628 RepID=A0A2T0R682_9ACTN|nr:hypothetical protein [Kineococcus rhizosphaerae]PRY16661.1 hypothetical protein CLV37_10392 [Kineococcus rhizosphaerae]
MTRFPQWAASSPTRRRQRLRTRSTGLLAVVCAVVCAVVWAVPAQAVVGGSVSRDGRWSVRLYEDGEPICTGALIAPQWVITGRGGVTGAAAAASSP